MVKISVFSDEPWAMMFMNRLLTRTLCVICANVFSGCLQGLEDHSRFEIKPHVIANAMGGNLNAVKEYVHSRGDINVTDRAGNTLLMVATPGDHVEVVDFLLKNGADPKRRNGAGETALEIAKRGAPKRVTKLLENAAR